MREAIGKAVDVHMNHLSDQIGNTQDKNKLLELTRASIIKSTLKTKEDEIAVAVRSKAASTRGSTVDGRDFVEVTMSLPEMLEERRDMRRLGFVERSHELDGMISKERERVRVDVALRREAAAVPREVRGARVRRKELVPRRVLRHRRYPQRGKGHPGSTSTRVVVRGAQLRT